MFYMKETLISNVVGFLGTIAKNLENRQEEVEILERIEVVDTTALVPLTRLPRQALKS